MTGVLAVQDENGTVPVSSLNDNESSQIDNGRLQVSSISNSSQGNQSIQNLPTLIQINEPESAGQIQFRLNINMLVLLNCILLILING